jgi:hypothetical protein
MNRLITGLLILLLLLASVACARETAAPVPPSPMPAPAPVPIPVPAPTPSPAPAAPVPPGSEPPGTPGAANDDIVSAPGGFTYRASIHQQGQPDWPPVQQSETALSTPSGSTSIRYRYYIETKAGEIRNNIVSLDARNAPEILDPLQITYRPEGLPDGITIERGQQRYGGIGGKDKKGSIVVLKIQIAPDVKSGEYSFAIYLDYEGKELGSLPITVNVLK